MSRIRRLTLVAGLSCMAIALASCGNMSKPYPEKNLFAIDAGPAPAAKQTATTTAAADVLRVRRFRVAAPYDGLTFVYRTGEAQYRTDYYNGFIVAPEETLTSETIRWLTAAGPFASVIDGGSTVTSRFLLEGNVTALYADLSDAKAPKAVIQARFFMIDESGADARVRFQKAYAATVPAGAGQPAEIAAALGKAWGQILTGLAADLARADLK
jgi:ABC-type uncharacterized transport system auxiliary subunit